MSILVVQFSSKDAISKNKRHITNHAASTYGILCKILCIEIQFNMDNSKVKTVVFEVLRVFSRIVL